MSTTVAAIITQAKRGFHNISTSDGVEYVNFVDRELLTAIPIYKTTEDLTLVAGTREYALNEADVRVWSADYLSTSTATPQPLRGVSVDELDAMRGGWRRDERGIPGEFYIDRNTTDQIIGFCPIPATSSSGGYPTVRLYVSRTRTLTSGDSLPKGLSRDDVYMFGIRWRYCLDRRPDLAEFWESQYADAFAKEVSAYASRNRRSAPSIMPMWTGGGGVV